MSAIESQKSKIENPFGPPPASLGYAMPAEWGLHEATWMAWPHFRGDWPGKFEPVPWVYAEIVRLLARGERVHIFVQPSKEGRFAKEVMAILERNHVNVAHVTLHTQATDRVWTRDSGPIFVQRKLKTQNSKLKTQSPRLKTRSAKVETAVVDFKFNAWARYDNNALDDRLPTAVADYLKIPRFIAYGENDAAGGGEFQRFVLEGARLT